MKRHTSTAFLTVLATIFSIAAVAPAHAFYADPVEVRALVQMPVAVAEVTTYDVPSSDIEFVVSRLNRAEVPVVQTVEVIRYTPFDRVITDYRPADTVAVDLPWDLGDLDMRLLVDTHFTDGLTGSSLGDAILSDLITLGFLHSGLDVWPVAPYPVEQDFVYYLEPGYRFERNGYFAYGDPVVIDRDYRVRDRVYDYPTYAYYDDGPDRRGYWENVDTTIYRRYRDHDPGIPPGHAKHDADGPHPTPGHTKHAGPGGPPGHAGDTARADDRRRPRPRQAQPARPDPGRPAQAAPAPGPKNKPPKAQGQSRGNAKAKPAKGNGGGKGNGKGNANGGGDGKGKGKGKGGGNGKGGNGKGQGGGR